MKVRTLLNKLKLRDGQVIRVADKKVKYSIESSNIREILNDCGRSSVVNFRYIDDEKCFKININKKKQTSLYIVSE